MLNNGNKQACGFEDVMVSYIYDEIATTERRKFESHLVDCVACTDEFASISNARFSVFEWQKEEFAHLHTPEIVIPVVSKHKIIEEQSDVGFLAGLRGLFSGFGLPVTVATALIICLGAGFAAMTFLGRGEQQVAGNVNVDNPALPVAVERQPNAVATGVDKAPEIGVVPTPKAIPTGEVRPLKASENRRSKPERQMTAQAQNARNQTVQKASQARKAPVLSPYDDSDDKSLRLSDLFDDGIGSGG